jgi:hypothetical protein
MLERMSHLHIEVGPSFASPVVETSFLSANFWQGETDEEIVDQASQI